MDVVPEDTTTSRPLEIELEKIINKSKPEERRQILFKSEDVSLVKEDLPQKKVEFRASKQKPERRLPKHFRKKEEVKEVSVELPIANSSKFVLPKQIPPEDHNLLDAVDS